MGNDWWRSWHGAPTDNKWLVIARKAGVSPGVVSAIVWALLDHASQTNPRGSVGDFDVETYAAFSGFDEKDIDRVLTVLQDKGVIDDAAMVTQWDKRQPKREDNSSTDRSRASRAKRDAMQRNATQPDAAGHTATLEKSREEKIREERKKERRSASPRAAAQRDEKRGPVDLPLNWMPNDKHAALAKQEGLTDDDLAREADRFRDHWPNAKPSTRKASDWDLRFNNWLRRHADRIREARPISAGQSGRAAFSLFRAAQRASARYADEDVISDGPPSVPDRREG